MACEFLFLTLLKGADWPQWRGPDRSGVSTETGLLKSWPTGGPKLLWEGGAVGEGFSSLAIVNGRIFTMGDKSGQSHLFCLDQKGGALLWSLKVGKSGGNYSGTRCTPTVDGDLVFALGQFGDLVCADVSSGRVRWSKNLASDFGGKSGGWNYSESVLVDGNNLICSPGGSQATALALNKRTGSTVWKTALPGGGESHYSSWVVSNGAGVKQYVRLFSGGTYGVAAANGKFLWRYDKLGKNTANIPTPIPFGDYVFTAAGYGKGGALIKLTRRSGGVVAEEVYFSRELKNKHGGIVKVGNYLYGDFDDRGSPWCAGRQNRSSQMASGWRWTRKRIRLRNLCGRTSLLSLSRWNHGPCRCIPAGWVPSGGFLQNSRWHEEKLGSSGYQRRFALPAWTQQNSLLRRSRSRSGRGSRSGQPCVDG